MTTNTLTTTLTQLDAWGHKTSVRVTWMPEETTGYDAGMDNIGRRTFAFDSIDTTPVRLRVVDGFVTVERVALSLAGSTSLIASCSEVDSIDDLEPGTYLVEEL